MDLPKGGRVFPKFTTPKTLTPQEQKRLLRAVRARGDPLALQRWVVIHSLTDIRLIIASSTGQ
jgi:hypothetical protein